MAAADDDQQLLQKVHGLNDLELAALLSLIAREHCIISTTPEAVDELTEELRLIAARTFGLSSAVVSCHAHTTLDDFATALLLAPSPQVSSPSGGGSSTNNISNTGRSGSPFRPRHQPLQHHHHHDPSGTTTAGHYFLPKPGMLSRGLISPSTSTAGSQPLIAHVVLAKHLDRAPRAVQIQALELLRTRRIFTRTSVQTAPKQFLFITVLSATSGGRAHVTPHLNDFFYLAHWHDPEDGFDYLDEEYGAGDEGIPGGEDIYGISDDDAASTDSDTSVVKHRERGSSTFTPSFTDARRSFSQAKSEAVLPADPRQPDQPPVFTETEIALLAQLGRQVCLDVDVARYQMNIISFLRTHRAVGSGITPTATKHFEQLMRSLAPLHGLDYVTPSLVALAAKKVYLHRIKMVAPEKERSMQWGSELAAVEAILDGLGPEDVIDDVLSLVAAPH
ncbi:hypothetical protein QBC34DRAFT_398309 [Podospora aff. communis PSN243]|uniref:magnesium chelatase n=1 Tax=Podospora aff. communis PSN243 TaxID=3040156 RepID=A0AAV9GX72_9PEZI|nr:hypothetical protein QBC34DRAFT_398309 [Podospora aff. communis PSN243]